MAGNRDQVSGSVLIFGCCCAVAIMLVVKAAGMIFSLDLPWTTAATVGAICAIFAMAGRFRKDASAESQPATEVEGNAPKTVSLPTVELEKVRRCFEVTTYLMYPLLMVCAYETNRSENYAFGSIWILAALAYFYSYHLFCDLTKK